MLNSACQVYNTSLSVTQGFWHSPQYNRFPQGIRAFVFFKLIKILRSTIFIIWLQGSHPGVCCLDSDYAVSTAFVHPLRVNPMPFLRVPYCSRLYNPFFLSDLKGLPDAWQSHSNTILNALNVSHYYYDYYWCIRFLFIYLTLFLSLQINRATV